MKFSAIRTIMRQQLVTNNILEEDRITLKMSASSAEKPEGWAKTSLAKRNSANSRQQQHQNLLEFSRVAHPAGSASMSSLPATPTHCANTMNTSACRDDSSKHKQQQHQQQQVAATSGGLLEKVYIMTRRVHEDAGQSYAKAASKGAGPNSNAKRSKASYNNNNTSHSGLFRPALVCLVAIVLSSCLLVVHADGNAGAASSALDGVGSESAKASDKHPNDRSDSLASKSETSAAPEKSEKSIVASLSSAVASAAAAAAVAAAQNSLSTNDARSLVTSSLHRHHHNQAQRSPGVNLAIKLVDTIPEVPYNILHNMKKLDHAAPFYNVPNKLSGSTTKESTQNFLTSALQASGSFGGAAEQLSALFRSPLWKRIATGYDEFTSEFRSRFRAPGAAPMKGPTSSTTTKLLRDISVPALLMLLASSVSGADWRPVRTRRKSFAPVDIPAGALPAAQIQSAIADLKPLQYYQPEQQQLQSKPSMDLMIGESAASGSWVDQASRLQQQQGQFSQPQQQMPQLQQQAMNRVNDLAAAAAADGSATWAAAAPSQVVSSGAPQPLPLAMGNGGQDQNQLYYGYQPAASAAFQQQQQQAVKRSDEISAPDGQFGATGRNLFSSLTSELAGGQAKLMSKLFNANVGADGHSYRLTNLADNFNKLSPTRRNLLSDKQRYSLVELSGGTDSSQASGDSAPPKSQAKPFLSAMAHAVSAMLTAAPHPSGGSGSESGSSPLAGKPSFFTRANLQQLIGAEQATINHEADAFARRQQQQQQQRDNSAAAEQRDLTKLLPESWREVVKRTMSSVQQQANVQWKSIEGQLANWVQDKLKVAAAAGAPGASSSASASSASASPASGGLGSNAPPAPVANMLASMSNTALNILGLTHKNSNSSTHSHSHGGDHHAASSVAKVEKSGADSAVSANQRGKLDKKQAASSAEQQQQPAKASGALASVASVLVKSLTNRQSSSQSAPSSPLSPSPPKSVASSAPATPTSDAPSSPSSSLSPKAQSPAAADETHSVSPTSSAASGIASKYPTLTGVQPEPAASPAQATATASQVAIVNNAND